MESLNGIQSGMALTATALAGLVLVNKLHTRLQLSMAKHPSLGGHLRMAKKFAAWIPGYSYNNTQWFVADGAPEHIGQQRKSAIERMGQTLQSKSPQTLAMSAELKPLISDLQLISEYRIPFQFRELMHQHIRLGSFWRESDGCYLTDMDGNRFIDVTGSYGVNLFGMDFYKKCIAQGVEFLPSVRTGKCQAIVRAVWHARGVVSHVWYRSGDASGSFGPLPHRQEKIGALHRCLPRLVGRCSTGTGQSHAAVFAYVDA